jgi:hypothetical protein
MNEMQEGKECCGDEKMGRKKWHRHHRPLMGGGAYGLVFVGAAIYYLNQATTFWMGILGILKALGWPALLIFKVFTMLKM